MVRRAFAGSALVALTAASACSLGDFSELSGGEEETDAGAIEGFSGLAYVPVDHGAWKVRTDGVVMSLP